MIWLVNFKCFFQQHNKRAIKQASNSRNKSTPRSGIFIFYYDYNLFATKERQNCSTRNSMSNLNKYVKHETIYQNNMSFMQNVTLKQFVILKPIGHT